MALFSKKLGCVGLPLGKYAASLMNKPTVSHQDLTPEFIVDAFEIHRLMLQSIGEQAFGGEIDG
jgi:hypothetical protein